MHKLVKIAAIIISVLSLVFLGLLMANSDAENNSWISPLIYISYFILAACVVLVLVFVLKNLFSNKDNLKRTLIVVGLFIGVVLISYLLADDSEVTANGIAYSGSTTKWVGTGLIVNAILSTVGVGLLIYSLLFKTVKR